MKFTFFQKAREHVEANHDSWYILSANHHDLEMDGPCINSYDETLSGPR